MSASMHNPLQIIHLGTGVLGAGRDLDREVLQWVTDKNNQPLLDNLPIELREDLSLAFLAFPREAEQDSPPEPLFSMLQMLENWGTMEVYYRGQLSWLVIIHQ